MKESLRRVVLFAVIVITGSVMILIDVPLIVLVPIILVTGLVILVLLGAITPSDIKAGFKRPKFENLKKIGFLKRLDEMKFFEKNKIQQEKVTQASKKKAGPVISNPKKTAGVSPFRTFLSSIGSLGTVLKERSRQRKKVEHINELLDKTVSEKVKGSALASAGKDAGPKISPVSGGGPGLQKQAKDQDVFMSLSGDEFDESLLDGLDETELSPATVPGPAPSPAAGNGPEFAIPEPDIPLPPLDISSQAEDILRNNEGSLEEFSGLVGEESLDQDFKDLDKLELDDVDLDVDITDETLPDGESPTDAAEKPGPEKPDTGVPGVKTDWIPSDAPKGAGNSATKTATEADISSFSKGVSGSDDDLLSSLASDVKHVKKERNLSLIRELKDFKAPATEIEDELKETYEMLKPHRSEKDKDILPARGMK